MYELLPIADPFSSASHWRLVAPSGAELGSTRTGLTTRRELEAWQRMFNDARHGR